MPDINPLEAFSIEELAEELETRFDQCVFYGRKLVDAENEQYLYYTAQKGSDEIAVFLLNHLEWIIHASHEETSREPESWEHLE